MQMVSISKLRSNPFQERKTFEGVERLSKSIKKHGFWGVLMAREKGGTYELAFGERRLRAAKVAGLKEIPIEVRKLSDEEMAELCVKENALQEGIPPLERAAHLTMLQRKFGPYSERDLAERTGLEHSTVHRLLALSGARASVKQAVEDGKIGWTAAVEAMEVGGVRFVETVKEQRMTKEEISDVKKAIEKHGKDREIKDKLLSGKISPIDLEIKGLTKEYMSVSDLHSRMIKETCRFYDVMKLIRSNWKDGTFNEMHKRMLLSELTLVAKEMTKFMEEVKKKYGM